MVGLAGAPALVRPGRQRPASARPALRSLTMTDEARSEEWARQLVACKQDGAAVRWAGALTLKITMRYSRTVSAESIARFRLQYAEILHICTWLTSSVPRCITDFRH